MTMLDCFREPRQRISAFLSAQLEEKSRELGGVNDFGRDVVERLYRFALQGKMIRGGLVFLGSGVSRPTASRTRDRADALSGAPRDKSKYSDP